MALSTSVNWISNFIIAFITPPLFGSIQGGYYFLLVGFTCISGVFVYFVYPETAGKTLEELGEVFGDKTADGRAARGGRDMDYVEVAEKSPGAPLKGMEVIATPNAFVDQREREHDVEDIHRREEESDEDDMVDVDVNSVDEEVEGRRELDADIHRAFLEVPSEVTLLVAEDEKEGGQEPSLEAKERTLEDVD